jgi:predicted outer membrane protein
MAKHEAVSPLAARQTAAAKAPAVDTSTRASRKHARQFKRDQRKAGKLLRKAIRQANGQAQLPRSIWGP